MGRACSDGWRSVTRAEWAAFRRKEEAPPTSETQRQVETWVASSRQVEREEEGAAGAWWMRAWLPLQHVRTIPLRMPRQTRARLPPHRLHPHRLRPARAKWTAASDAAATPHRRRSQRTTSRTATVSERHSQANRLSAEPYGHMGCEERWSRACRHSCSPASTREPTTRRAANARQTRLRRLKQPAVDVEQQAQCCAVACEHGATVRLRL